MRSTLILDTGAFIAAERWDRTLLALIDGAASDGIDVVVSAVVVAEAWREPARANAAMLLEAGSVAPLERAGAKRAGSLLGRAGSAQVVDASVADLAVQLRPAVVLTADPEDIYKLVTAAGHSCAVVSSKGEVGAKRADVLIQAL